MEPRRDSERGGYLFDGEVIDQVMVVFIEAAVQRHTIRVKEQVLRRDPRKKKVPQLNT